jgi:hypothetical protein
MNILDDKSMNYSNNMMILQGKGASRPFKGAKLKRQRMLVCLQMNSCQVPALLTAMNSSNDLLRSSDGSLESIPDHARPLALGLEVFGRV